MYDLTLLCQTVHHHRISLIVDMMKTVIVDLVLFICSRGKLKWIDKGLNQ